MQILGPADPAPSKEELIAKLAQPIARVIAAEMADESDVDRIWLLRKVHKAALYYRDLAYFAPALYQGLVDATGVDGSILPDSSWQGNGVYDYSQNIYRGYCRKLEAVLGTRIPNAVASPDDPSDEKDIQAARAANNAALYIRHHAELQVQILWLVFSLYNFGTSFWSIEWVEDGARNGYKEVPQLAPEQSQLGGGFQCPQCGATSPGDQRPPSCPQCGADMSQSMYSPPTPVSVPASLPPQQIPRGSLEINVLDASEVSVPLDADGRRGIDDCHWLRREREQHKAKLLARYGDRLREAIKGSDNSFDDQSVSLQYGESVRSAMASPIGVVRPRRENRWTEMTEDWTPCMYELLDDQPLRQLLYDNFPDGLRITSVKGHIIDLENRSLAAHWQECQPEPTKRIMCEPLGDDWIITQDLLSNILNQCNETIERSNEPGFADPTRVDLDAWQRRRDNPADLIPAVRPPGGTLADLIYRPPPVTFSEQIPPFRQQVEQTSKETSGLLDIIWGGGNEADPTARQSELKTNAAIRQLSVIWVMIGKSLERLYEKACKLLAENEDGVLAFTKPKANEYGKFDSVSVVIEDLKAGNYHFEADESIPMTWGQQRDLLMWFLDKPAELLKVWGLDDPLNIHEFKELLGMPGMKVPHLDDRDKGMDVIGKLLNDKSVPGQPNPDGTPGDPQPSVMPDWEDDNDFMAKLVRSYIITNFELKESNPDGYENLVLYGKAQEAAAQQPPPVPPPKATVAVSLKGENLGDAAITAALQKVGIEPPGQSTVTQPPPPKPMPVPVPMPVAAPNGDPAGPPAALAPPGPPAPAPVQ